MKCINYTVLGNVRENTSDLGQMLTRVMDYIEFLSAFGLFAKYGFIVS